MIQTRERPRAKITFVTPRRERKGLASGFVFHSGVFDHHVLELAGLEDISALQAFDEFCVFFAGDNLHTRVLTFVHGVALLGGLRRRD